MCISPFYSLTELHKIWNQTSILLVCLEQLS